MMISDDTLSLRHILNKDCITLEDFIQLEELYPKIYPDTEITSNFKLKNVFLVRWLKKSNDDQFKTYVKLKYGDIDLR